MRNSLCLIFIVLGLWLLSSTEPKAGFAFIMLGAYSFWRPLSNWPSWGYGLIGLWLQISPLIVEKGNTFFYFNGTITGMLAILLSSLPIPEKQGLNIPHGWSYNPSSWQQRLPIVGLALLAWAVCLYLAAYQLGYLNGVWDPLFDKGTLRFLTSRLTRHFPLLQAKIFAFFYAFLVLLCCKGNSGRWYVMPWIVVLFECLGVSLGLAVIGSTFLQYYLLSTWSFWYLLISLTTLFLISFSADEFLAAAYGKIGHWSDTINPREVFPWTLLLSFLLGCWLMFPPFMFSMMGKMAFVYSVLGGLIVIFSVLSMVEVTRSLRWINFFWGICLVVLSWMLITQSALAQWNSSICGILLMILTIPRGKIRERYGEWNRYIF